MGRETRDQVTLSALPLCLAVDPRTPASVCPALQGRVGEALVSGTGPPGVLLGAGKGRSSLPPQGRPDHGPGSEPGWGSPGGQGRHLPWGHTWGLCRALEMVRWPRGFSSLKTIESWASEHQGCISQKPNTTEASGPVLCPSRSGRRDRGLLVPSPAKPSPSSIPTAETYVLGAATPRALPPVSP